MSASPRVLLLDGDYPSSITIAKELSEDIGATVIGAGTTAYSRLLRSRYCDVEVTVAPTDDDRYAESLLSAIRTHRPAFVLPVGYQSAAQLQCLRPELPSSVTVCLPSAESFCAGSDKATTASYATDLGIDVPTDYSSLVESIDANGRSADALARLEFPVFLKARREAGGGGATTARVNDPARFWEAYDEILAAAPTDDVLVQELVDGPGMTYGVGVLCLDNEVVLRFCHEELRSVPRRGGSGTLLRICRDTALERRAAELLRSIGWHGIALVEFTQRADGSFVLMEINPKFWASYALASAHGYRFASTMVASALDLDADVPFGTAESVGEMVFPLRELYHCARNPTRRLARECLETALRPGVDWNVDRDDIGAWLTPPVDIVRRMPTFERPRTRIG
ncbi:ATP-dependent carboxylate-amine ligase [Natrinema marinum]|uniref:carboxylate--amine ligase n=1 Tax=Natrinema marinum TaxID=2961598 RepID=UPI0020C867C1|nr:ATP-dependent carboxylate-amine ligase [Natrinema marinum]